MQLNNVLTDALGDWAKNPLFRNAVEGGGVLNVSVVKLNDLPVDGRLNDVDPANTGEATVKVSIHGLKLSSPFSQKLGAGTGVGRLLGNLDGDVSEYTVTIKGGVTHHDMTLRLGALDGPIRLTGGVRMDNLALSEMRLILPPQMLQHIPKFGPQLAKALPKGLEMPITGTLDSPQFDFGEVLKANLGDNLLKGIFSGNPEDAIQSIPGIGDKIGLPKGVNLPKGIPNIPGLPGAKKPAPGSQTKPADPDLGGVIGDILGGAGKEGKEKKDKKKKDKDRRDGEK